MLYRSRTEPSFVLTQLDPEPCHPGRTCLQAARPFRKHQVSRTRLHTALAHWVSFLLRTISWKMKYSPLRFSRVRTCAVRTLEPSNVRCTEYGGGADAG